MFEKVKKYLNNIIVSDPVTKQKETILQPLPIEVNSQLSNLVNRKKARLTRLLTIQQPNAEVKSEIVELQQLFKGI